MKLTPQAFSLENAVNHPGTHTSASRNRKQSSGEIDFRTFAL